MTSRRKAAGRNVELKSSEILSRERKPPVPKEQWPRPDVDASWLSMKLVLNQSQHMFNCQSTLTEDADNFYGDLLKTIFRKTQRQHETRHWLGTSADLWGDFANCLEEFVVQVQDLYQLPRQNDPQEETFTALVGNNAAVTLKDFQRSNDLILVARNMLANCPDAQRYAVETTCHHEILNIIQICVEFNSEGFAGEAGSIQEQTFGLVISAAKTLLVSCLQFLFNLLKAGPELRTRIWLDILCLDIGFGIKSSSEEAGPRTKTFKTDAELRQQDFDSTAKRILGYYASPTSGQLLRELLMDFRNNSLLLLHVDKLYKIGLLDVSPLEPQMVSSREKLSIDKALGRIQAAKRALVAPLNLDLLLREEEGETVPQESADDFLRFRKSFYPTEQDFTYQKGLPPSPYNFSEIPIILAPSGEIEALPMLILVCIFSSGDISTLKEKDRLEQAMRCLFLVRSSTGRMLFRELYIFIAAWDLPEDELFFKGMMNITNSLHQHNLLYDAYEALADPKDIVSPGQNVLVKLVLHIFKSTSDPLERYESRSAALKNLDIGVVRFLLCTFRSNILPRALAIIWLQGKFRDGKATAEDFERANLNLWDMERTYEGVYQYLEFFSALNDNPIWKYHGLQLEIAWDIVELIRYLHKCIPIQPFIVPAPPPLQQSVSQTSSSSRDLLQRATSSADGRISSTERPYSPAPSNRSAPFPVSGGDPSSSQAQIRSDTSSPSSPSTAQPPQTYPWRNLKKMAILVLSGLLYNTPSLREKIRSYEGVLLIASCSEHDENNPYIKEHAVLCLKLLLEGDRENQRLVEELRAHEVRSAPGLENLGYRAGVDEAGRVRVWRTRNGAQGQKEEVLLPVVPGETLQKMQLEVATAAQTAATAIAASGDGGVPRASSAKFVEVFSEDADDDDQDEASDDNSVAVEAGDHEGANDDSTLDETRSSYNAKTSTTSTGTTAVLPSRGRKQEQD